MDGVAYADWLDGYVIGAAISGEVFLLDANDDSISTFSNTVCAALDVDSGRKRVLCPHGFNTNNLFILEGNEECFTRSKK